MRAAVIVAAVLAPVLMAPGRAAPKPAGPTGLCRAGEEVLFACDVGPKKVAVCGGTAKDGRYAQYRYGTAARIELAFPERGAQGLTYATEAYSGGGQEEIVFARGGLTYGVFSRMIRTQFKAGRPNNPKFDAGVFVKRGDLFVSDRKCTRPFDAAIDLNLAEKYLESGPSVDHFSE